jgi:hypothetical protein
LLPVVQGLDYYLTNYPADGDKVLGFLDYQLLLLLQLDHIYSAWYFYAAIALLGASLMACTYTTQLPTAKVGRNLLSCMRLCVSSWHFSQAPAHNFVIDGWLSPYTTAAVEPACHLP